MLTGGSTFEASVNLDSALSDIVDFAVFFPFFLFLTSVVF